MLNAYLYLHDLPPGGFAWEFLRRNPKYNEQYESWQQGDEGEAERISREWGCCFPVNPELRADQGSVLWPPHIDPATVILLPAPEGFAARSIEPIAAEPKGRSALGEYWVVGVRRMSMTLVLDRGATPSSPLAALIPLNSEVGDRLEAVAQLCSLLDGEADAGHYQRIGYLGRTYLGLKLRALDARRNGHSYRIIAGLLFGSEVVTKGADLKTKGVISRTRYLVKEGQKLMSGRYRKLLKLPYRKKVRGRRRSKQPRC